MALTDNLVSYWKLDESSGNASDSVGSNNLTNNNSVSYTSAKINNGADFGSTNTNKYLSYNSGAIGSVNADKSISLWVKINTDLTGTDIYTIFFEWGFGSNYAGYLFEYSRVSSTNMFSAVRDRGCVGGDKIDYNNPTASAGYYHLVMTLSSTTLKFYVNNSLVGSTTINTGSGICNGQNGIYVGTNRGQALFSPVIVDEIGIWSRALSSTEVSELYNSGAGLQYPFTTDKPSLFPFFTNYI